MQVLGVADPLSRTSAENYNSNDISQANSAISLEDQGQQVTSTIGKCFRLYTKLGNFY